VTEPGGNDVHRSQALLDEARQYKTELIVRLPDAVERTAPAFGAQLAGDIGPRARRVATTGNIQGVGYGVKVVGSRATSEAAVRVYVRTKLPRRDLARVDVIPDEVNGQPTDVIAVGDIVAHPRPVPCGVSIGHVDITAGTLGCLLRRAGDDATYLLSNNHVLANVNQAQLGDSILEPGPADGGVEPIAQLSDFEPIKLWGGANLIDAAVARLLDPDDVLPEIAAIGAVQNPPVDAALYQSVRKHGRTTRHTVGVVTDLSADLWVRVLPRQMAWFEDQLGVQGGVAGDFSQPGDSGSLVVDGVSRAAVGLLFAGGQGQTFVNPIEPVLARFDATIISGSEEA